MAAGAGLDGSAATLPAPLLDIALYEMKIFDMIRRCAAISVPGFALHGNVLLREIGVDTLVNSQERRALVIK